MRTCKLTQKGLLVQTGDLLATMSLNSLILETSFSTNYSKSKHVLLSSNIIITFGFPIILKSSCGGKKQHYFLHSRPIIP